LQNRKIVVVLKGYPRLSETFIAQELLGLERAGFDLILFALRRPTDAKRHPVHDEIKAPVPKGHRRFLIGRGRADMPASYSSRRGDPLP